MAPAKGKKNKKNSKTKKSGKSTKSGKTKKEETSKSKGKGKAKAKVSKPKGKRVVTPQTYVETISSLVELLSSEISEKKENRKHTIGIRWLQSLRKQIRELEKEFRAVQKFKPPRKPRNGKQQGLEKPGVISKELAKFLKVDNDTMLSRCDVTRAITTYVNWDDDKAEKLRKSGTFDEKMGRWEYLNPLEDGERARDLRNTDDKRVIMPDKTLTRLLGYDDYCESVANGEVTVKRKNKETGVKQEFIETDDSLRYYTIQRLMGRHINIPKAVAESPAKKKAIVIEESAEESDISSEA